MSMPMLLSSADVLSGLSVVAYRKLVEDKKTMGLKEGVWIAVVSALARAWANSPYAVLSLDPMMRRYVYGALLNVVRDVLVDKAKLDAENLVMDGLEGAIALAVGDWLKNFLAISW